MKPGDIYKHWRHVSEPNPWAVYESKHADWVSNGSHSWATVPVVMGRPPLMRWSAIKTGQPWRLRERRLSVKVIRGEAKVWTPPRFERAYNNMADGPCNGHGWVWSFPGWHVCRGCERCQTGKERRARAPNQSGRWSRTDFRSIPWSPAYTPPWAREEESLASINHGAPGLPAAGATRPPELEG